MSATAVGKAIGLSRPAVQDRIKSLEDRGVIAGYHAKINEDAGVLRALMFLTIAKRPCDAALRWLEKQDEITAVLSISGDLDAVVSITVPGPKDLSKLSDRVLGTGLFNSLTTSIILYQSNDL